MKIKLVNNKKGIALILTFIFMVSLIIVVSSYLYMVTYQTRHVGTQSTNDQALYLAESALNHAVYYLTNTAPDSSTDGSWRTDDNYAYPLEPPSYPGGTRDPQQENLGNGTYTMWVETSGSNIQVTARGTMNGIERIIRETITLTAGVPEAFNYAQHTSGNIDFDGASGSITGDLNSGGSVNDEGGMTITGTITESSSIVTPTVNMASYEAIADYTESSDKTFSANTTYSGIWYVDGNVYIKNKVTMNGTIVATGDIDFENKKDFIGNPSSNNPALVTQGSIKGKKLKTSNISGLVYASGNITFEEASSITINGSFVASGNIEMKNSSGWSITYDSTLSSDPPPYFSGGETGGGGATGDSWIEL